MLARINCSEFKRIAEVIWVISILLFLLQANWCMCIYFCCLFDFLLASFMEVNHLLNHLITEVVVNLVVKLIVFVNKIICNSKKYFKIKLITSICNFLVFVYYVCYLVCVLICFSVWCVIASVICLSCTVFSASLNYYITIGFYFFLFSALISVKKFCCLNLVFDAVWFPYAW